MIISPRFFKKLHWLPVRQRILLKIVLITYKSSNDMAPEYLCELMSIRKSLRKLGHTVRYYCRCQCLGSSHMVIVHLVLQPPLCGIGCRQMFEMRRLFNMLNVFQNPPVHGHFHRL